MTLRDSKIIQIAIAIAIPLISVFLVWIIFPDGMEPWYSQLYLPYWHPQKWIFPPVWLYLYISMGFASYRVWYFGDGFSGPAALGLAMYAIQLLVNITWSPIFFTFHLLGAAVIYIGVLLVSVILTTVLFFQIDVFAGILFIPYIAWVSFASFLCYTIYILNP